MPPCMSTGLGSVFMAQPLPCRSSLCAHCATAVALGSGISLFKKKDSFIMYTLFFQPGHLHARRGHQVSSQRAVRHHVGAEN